MRTSLIVCLWATLALASSGQTPEPKYKPCPANNPRCYAKDLGHSNRGDCTVWCSANPLLITPNIIEGCENRQIKVNVRIQPPKLEDGGNSVNWAKGKIDWGDGVEENLAAGPPWDWQGNYTHVYEQARDYSPSAMYAADMKYHGAGSCSYHCEVQQSARAVIHLATSPECKGGVFNKAAVASPAAKKAPAKKAVKKATAPTTK